VVELVANICCDYAERMDKHEAVAVGARQRR
jgi:hypothetical protein